MYHTYTTTYYQPFVQPVDTFSISRGDTQTFACRSKIDQTFHRICFKVAPLLSSSLVRHIFSKQKMSPGTYSIKLLPSLFTAKLA